MYERAVERGHPHQDERLEHAARHRKFAQEDRWMAERLRQMADTGFAVREHHNAEAPSL
jgi:hypothetical protein